MREGGGIAEQAKKSKYNVSHTNTHTHTHTHTSSDRNRKRGEERERPNSFLSKHLFSAKQLFDFYVNPPFSLFLYYFTTFSF
jgi:hypothetical protein